LILDTIFVGLTNFSATTRQPIDRLRRPCSCCISICIKSNDDGLRFPSCNQVSQFQHGDCFYNRKKARVEAKEAKELDKFKEFDDKSAQEVFGPMKIRNIFNGIHLISAILACIFLAFQLIIISVNVTLRYFFNSGISWTEEISTNVLMTAFTFLSMAIGVKLDTHINVNLIPKRAPRWITTVLLKLKYLVLSVIGFVILYYGTSLIFMIKGRIASIPVLPAYLQFIMIPLAGVLILYDSIMSLLGLEKDDKSLDQKFMSVGEKR
jgi:TRAP-type transport system small permease protein